MIMLAAVWLFAQDPPASGILNPLVSSGFAGMLLFFFIRGDIVTRAVVAACTTRAEKAEEKLQAVSEQAIVLAREASAAHGLATAAVAEIARSLEEVRQEVAGLRNETVRADRPERGRGGGR